MTEEARQGRSIKIKPSVLRKAHIRAIESGERVGHWVEKAIEEQIAGRKTNHKVKIRKMEDTFLLSGLLDVQVQ